jgi:hypothetical protein
LFKFKESDNLDPILDYSGLTTGEYFEN